MVCGHHLPDHFIFLGGCCLSCPSVVAFICAKAGEIDSQLIHTSLLDYHRSLIDLGLNCDDSVFLSLSSVITSPCSLGDNLKMEIQQVCPLIKAGLHSTALFSYSSVPGLWREISLNIIHKCVQHDSQIRDDSQMCFVYPQTIKLCLLSFDLYTCIRICI